MVKNKLYTLNCNQRLLTISSPIIMGIINATPDSFYNKGKNSSIDEMIANAKQMMNEGATILDIGGMSSRPGAAIISEQEEMDRVLPIIEAIKKEIPTIFLSIDTYRSPVAEECIKAGIDIINDISGAELDAEIIDIAAKYQTPYICMHMQGTPQTMQKNPSYENVTNEVYQFLYNKIQLLKSKNVVDVISDVGFGFGKTTAHNFELLKNLEVFQQLNTPTLVGISRKSMIYKTLNSTPENALNGTTALNMIALQNGAAILRVHDVKEAKECIALWGKINNNS
jgi:dihydropteroate synthase